MRSIITIVVLIFQLTWAFHSTTNAFTTTSTAFLSSRNSITLSPKQSQLTPMFNSVPEEEERNDDEVKRSLDEKLKSWEATEEEIKAASLGGLTPKSGVDGFDIGLYIAFPIMIATGLLFGIFPFIMDKIDVSSVGPPPMV
eukprot:CAMPEP_0197822978 /NCGR_PEP_ID=MMETSP1437-20131217/293_1 /TAXON_ID=49252 ORGANISM="Eucampia antarctica, Strain CCMP1452" /NCGR_SAMPLE_ID=MMETSP1437 /ASSEMBLY_ACC=CAM_ASM_001096 /LENGTH=140 /DNA_ID=CAMNT_0043421895 /DNA_START=47 /DNA_END=469 /DNA_ORIENTATION=+